MRTHLFSITIFLIATICSCNNSENGRTDEATIAKLFPPINIQEWDKTPVVNGRLPTEAETKNGTSLLYYPNPTPDVKVYNLPLPKLAYYIDSNTKKEELVVVIQIVQTAQDTMVGYRPLSGGNGASVFRDFRFLSEDEVKILVGE